MLATIAYLAHPSKSSTQLHPAHLHCKASLRPQSAPRSNTTIFGDKIRALTVLKASSAAIWASRTTTKIAQAVTFVKLESSSRQSAKQELTIQRKMLTILATVSTALQAITARQLAFQHHLACVQLATTAIDCLRLPDRKLQKTGTILSMSAQTRLSSDHALRATTAPKALHILSSAHPEPTWMHSRVRASMIARLATLATTARSQP